MYKKNTTQKKKKSILYFKQCLSLRNINLRFKRGGESIGCWGVYTLVGETIQVSDSYGRLTDINKVK